MRTVSTIALQPTSNSIWLNGCTLGGQYDLDMNPCQLGASINQHLGGPRDVWRLPNAWAPLLDLGGPNSCTDWT